MVNDRWGELAESLRKPNTLVVNLYGGPGTGKSTTAALVFAMLKQAGHTAELVTEVAKDFVWEKREKSLGDQVYIFGKQYHKIWRLLGEVDVIVSDAPLLLSLVYAAGLPGGKQVGDLALALHKSMRTLDIFISRDNEKHPYNPRGRYQDLQGAERVDRKVKNAITGVIPFKIVPVGDGAAETIIEMITSA